MIVDSRKSTFSLRIPGIQQHRDCHRSTALGNFSEADFAVDGLPLLVILRQHPRQQHSLRKSLLEYHRRL